MVTTLPNSCPPQQRSPENHDHAVDPTGGEH